MERMWFRFQAQGPSQVKAYVRWWYWIVLAVVVGGAVAAVVLGHTSSPRQHPVFGGGFTAGGPSGERQVADRPLGNGFSIQLFDNALSGPTSQPQISYEVVQDDTGVQRGPLFLGTTPHLAVPGLALMRGDPDGEGAGWRWTTIYEVTDPSISVVRAVFAGHVVDTMRPVTLDDIRFVVLTADQEAARVHVEGLSRAGRVLASAPLADPTFGKAIP